MGTLLLSSGKNRGLGWRFLAGEMSPLYSCGVRKVLVLVSNSYEFSGAYMKRPTAMCDVVQGCTGETERRGLAARRAALARWTEEVGGRERGIASAINSQRVTVSSDPSYCSPVARQN